MKQLDSPQKKITYMLSAMEISIWVQSRLSNHSASAYSTMNGTEKQYSDEKHEIPCTKRIQFG